MSSVMRQASRDAGTRTRAALARRQREAAYCGFDQVVQEAAAADRAPFVAWQRTAAGDRYHDGWKMTLYECAAIAVSCTADIQALDQEDAGHDRDTV